MTDLKTTRKAAIATATAQLASIGWVLNPKTLTARYQIRGFGSIHLRCSDPREYGRDVMTVRAVRVHRMDLADVAADFAAASNSSAEVRLILNSLQAAIAV